MKLSVDVDLDQLERNARLEQRDVIGHTAELGREIELQRDLRMDAALSYRKRSCFATSCVIGRLVQYCKQFWMKTAKMGDGPRSGCPINLALEVLGDKWSLLILRDMIFGGKRHFRELMRSQEGISSNILADRLGMLVSEGLLTKADDPTHKQKAIYSLTEKAIELVPVFAHVGAWGRKHLPASEELSIRAEVLETGGPALWEQFMRELRQEHVRRPTAERSPDAAASVRDMMQSAYERVVERRRNAASKSAGGRRRG